MVHLTLISEARWSCSTAFVGCFEDEPPETDHLPEPLRHAVGAVAGRPGWAGRRGQSGEAEAVGLGETGPAVSLAGLGKRAEFDDMRLERWIARITGRSRVNGSRRLGVVLPDHPRTRGPASAERVARQLILGDYRFDRFRRSQERSIEAVEVVPPPGEEKVYAKALKRAETVAAGVVLARDLANTPPNEATPQWLAERAEEMAASHGIAYSALGPSELEERGMGGILAVASGSRNPPRLVRLEWGTGGPVVALVGKGVTFDSGGLSLKPSAAMEEMKYDKAAACSMVGVAQAVASLALPVRLKVYLPLVENMPDGGAFRPSDIVRCYNGKTVEILNTDAEGRMILADAMAWAVEEKPDSLFEMSTLTGGAIAALGLNRAALYTPHDGLAEELLGASRDTADPIWRMPLAAEFLEAMKGTHADLKNVGGRWGAANMAAAFLGQFVGSFDRWAHLDIAGPAYVRGDAKEYQGATGFGVALILAWLTGLAGRRR